MATGRAPSTKVHVIDSHTEGEPTRVVVEGGPDLGPLGTSVAEQLRIFRARYDWFRSAVVNEPRGFDAMVGALLCRPANPRAVAGVIFFNNVGFLNACGHGTIGVAKTLLHLGRVGHGSHLIETPVGEVTIHIADDSSVTIDNVPSFRAVKNHEVIVPKLGRVVGDIAWGGNWFFLVSDHGQTLDMSNLDGLTNYTWALRQALAKNNPLVSLSIESSQGAPQEVDHIELFGPPTRADADSKNFVLCPGKAYDRSPCGTGTSAKMACLFDDAKLKPGQLWRQESIIGSLFTGRVRVEGDRLIPSISGSAYITAECDLIIDESDPFRHGIVAH